MPGKYELYARLITVICRANNSLVVTRRANNECCQYHTIYNTWTYKVTEIQHKMCKVALDLSVDGREGKGSG